jgi:hypothetical protein
MTIEITCNSAQRYQNTLRTKLYINSSKNLQDPTSEFSLASKICSGTYPAPQSKSERVLKRYHPTTQ